MYKVQHWQGKFNSHDDDNIVVDDDDDDDDDDSDDDDDDDDNNDIYFMKSQWSDGNVDCIHYLVLKPNILSLPRS